MLKVIELIPKELGEKLCLGEVSRIVSEDIILNGTVYCIKNCLKPDAIDGLRKDVFNHYAHLPQTRISYDDRTSTLNYHSIEKGVSSHQKTLHYFHGYVFNDISQLPANLKLQIEGLFNSLLSLYNDLFSSNHTLDKIREDGKKIRAQIFQYPVGGGMFATHTHPLDPQKIGIILGCSKRNRDFNEGGGGFEMLDGSIIETGSVQDIGDIVLFRYDLKHWVSPCDINSALDDSKIDGRWSAVMPIY